MTDAELNLVAQVMGVSAPFIALYLTFWWEARKERRRRR